jgi:hypothetical protein
VVLYLVRGVLLVLCMLWHRWEMYDEMCIFEYGFVWCIICSPFFVWYGEDGDWVLVFFCGEVSPLNGFLYIFFIVWVGISVIYPFIFKGSSVRSKYGVPLEW